MDNIEEDYEKLSEKQKRFIDYFIEYADGNKAAITAGYSEKTARIIASQNLSKLNRFIQWKMESIKTKNIASQQDVLEFLTNVMAGKEKDAFGLDASLQDRIKCAELLGKRYGSFVEKKEINGAIPVIISGDDALAE